MAEEGSKDLAAIKEKTEDNKDNLEEIKEKSGEAQKEEAQIINKRGINEFSNKS